LAFLEKQAFANNFALDPKLQLGFLTRPPT
jgi:hypothetical protein